VREWWAGSSLGRYFGWAWAAGLLMLVVTFWIAGTENLPIRDPDAFIPGYFRMPLIVLAAILTDIVPRAVHRAGGRMKHLPTAWREVTAERWPRSHWVFALSGMAAWYLTYATFRNIKSFVPFVNHHSYDSKLNSIDKAIFFGREPGDLLHDLIGTGFTAQLMSAVYFVWIFLVPVSIAVALVWTRHNRAGSWYVTAVAFDWLLGALTYLLVPTVGPIYSDPAEFSDLPHTYATWLSETLMDDRTAVLADPWSTGALQSIAAFASLHVGIMMTICLVAHFVRLPKWIRVAAWCFLAATCFSTVYLGWHFFVDVMGGFVLGTIGFWMAALATGNHVGVRPRLRAEEPELEPVASAARL
jgi:membrane-associated phospholipid phosphatase